MGKTIIFLCFSFIMLNVAFGQGTEKPIDDDYLIFKVVEQMPTFKEGPDSLKNYFATPPYPVYARENAMEGITYVEFIVSKEGSIKDIRIARSSGFPFLDSVAITHVATMPEWEPGMQRGEKVNVSYVVAVKFKLTGDDIVYKMLDDMPDYPGGKEALDKYLSTAPAPVGYTKSDLAGQLVRVTAVIKANGELANIAIPYSKGNIALEEVAIKHIMAMPLWNPATKDGKNVKVSMSFMVSFVPPKK